MDRPGDPSTSRGRSPEWRGERTRVLETLPFKVVALVLTSTLALLLWQFAIAAIGYSATVLGARQTAQAVVETCPRGFGVEDACIVRFTDDAGRARSDVLEHPGIFALSPGDRIDVAISEGSVGMAGWQPIADAGLLALLAVAVTGYAIGWWRRVLEHQNPLYDGSDPEDDFTALRDPSDPHRQD